MKNASKYTRQNTGRHFLDSGDVYGRHYERDVDPRLCYFDNWGTPVINLTEWLNEFAEYHPLHKSFYRWANNRDGAWFDLTPEFFDAGGYKQEARGNIYNDDNDFDQVYVWEIYVPEWSSNSDWIYNDDAIIVIFAHTGCDVRGGYSAPMIVTFPSCEYAIPMDAQCSLYSDDLDDTANERLRVGYSGYPIGELEKMGYTFTRLNDDDDAAIYVDETGNEITVHCEVYI